MSLVAMPVFNEIDFDGRVERCAAALGERRRVVVYALDSGKPYTPAGFEAVRLNVPGLGRLRILRPFLFWLGFLWWAIRKRPDVIHAHDYYMAFPGWLAARLVGAAFVYDAHELLVPRPGERLRLSERIYYRLEALVVGRAEAVIAANAKRAEIMAEHYHLTSVPLVVRNIPRPEAEPDDCAAAAGVPGLPPKRPGGFRLIYQGYLAERFHLDRYVRAVAELGEDFELVMCGPGPASEALAAQAARDCAGRVHLLGRVPRRFLKAILRSGDAGIIVYGSDSLNEIHCAPNKVFEYAMAGLPSIANGNPGLREIIEEGGIGIADDDALAAIRAMAKGLDEFRAVLPLFLERNSWDGECAVLERLYRGLEGEPCV
ncbi:MAG: glycosyltransferase [Magnetospirillum sp.]|nr:glycosyltransferase [Magnetospirillum sp.]